MPPHARRSLWDGPREPRRPALTREAIVTAAVALADAEGLPAVSIRRVASELGAPAMSLYGHIDRKEDLLDLMADQVAGEVVLDGELPAGWRAAVTAIALAERAAVRRHPWMVDLVSRRAEVGPNRLRHLDQSVAALAPLGLDPDSTWQVLTAITDYTSGRVIRSVLERRAGSDPLGSRHLRDALATGRFPHLATLLDGVGNPGDDTFERGLGWLLDGIEAEFGPGR